MFFKGICTFDYINKRGASCRWTVFNFSANLFKTNSDSLSIVHYRLALHLIGILITRPIFTPLTFKNVNETIT